MAIVVDDVGRLQHADAVDPLLLWFGPQPDFPSVLQLGS
jgi:hypothetical protein